MQRIEDDLIDLGAASVETKGSGPEVDDFISPQLEQPGALSAD